MRATRRRVRSHPTVPAVGVMSRFHSKNGFRCITVTQNTKDADWQACSILVRTHVDLLGRMLKAVTRTLGADP
ncbi:MAG: hypothetical protein QOD58_3428 [Mycobacterium sp.]|nr:hypothetical protein [Mycobacterium sp.]